MVVHVCLFLGWVGFSGCLAGFFAQQHAAFYMRGVGELVKQGGGGNFVGLREYAQIGGECVGIAGNIDDVGEAGNQREGVCIYTGARRIDKYGGKGVIGKADALFGKAAEIAAA